MFRMTKEIQDRMLELSDRRFDQRLEAPARGMAIDELMSYIDRIESVDSGTARVLLRLLRDPPSGMYPDPGHVNEHIGAAVESAPPDIWCRSILEEFPLLLERSPYMLADFLSRALRLCSVNLSMAFSQLEATKRKQIAGLILSNPEIIGFLEAREGGQAFIEQLRLT